MRSHVEFRSPALREADLGGEQRGGSAATLLAEQLPTYGFEIIWLGPEDWGWRIDLKNETFPLWIGCGHYEEHPDAYMCFIEPSRPYVRRWWKRVSTRDLVEYLATAIDAVLRTDTRIAEIRWWTEAEAHHGQN